MSCNGVQLIIKNIPLNVDDKILREVFEKHGHVLELKIKTYGWFEQKHASVHYATKKHSENAFAKLNDSFLGGNKIKANWIKTEMENNNGEVDNKTSSHNLNASAFVHDKLQVNSKTNPIVQDKPKVQDDSKANLEVQGIPKAQDDSKANPKVQDDSKANAEVQENSKANPKVQDDSKANAEVHENSKANPEVQENSKANAIPNDDSKCEGRRNVYVSGLSQNVSESILKAEFEKHAKVDSITILKPSKWKSDCNHGYVTLDSNASAEKVIHELNQTPICGKRIKVNWAIDESDYGCVCISGLPLIVTEDDLRKQLERYGRLLPLKIKFLKSAEKDEQHTYVTYVRQESAKNAVQAMNWSQICGKTIVVILKNDIKRSREIEKELFVQHLPPTTDKVSIREVFQKYGEVTFVRIFRGFFETNGFVRYFIKDSAQKALAALNGETVFGKIIRVSWAKDRLQKSRQGLQKKSTNSQELEQGKKTSLNFQAKADDVKASSGRGKGSWASTKSSKTNTVGKLKVEAASIGPLGRGRGQCRALHQPPPCILGIQTPPRNIQTPTQSSTDKDFLANQSVNHRFSSIVHKYSAMVFRPLSKEAISGIKYVLEVSLKSELENLATCIRKVTKLKASVDGDGKANRTEKAVESLGIQLLQTLNAVDWTKLASFYNKTATCPRTETKMTEADILSKLRREDEKFSEAEGRVNELINHLRSIVLALEDVEESNGMKPVLDVELEDYLEKAQECLDYPAENRDEDMIVWGKNKVEEILDEIDSAWNIAQEDSDVIKLLKTTENPLRLFEKKDSVKNKKIAKPKSADTNGNKSLLRNKVQNVQSKNQSRGALDDSNHCLREKKPQTKLGKKSTVKFKSTETGFMQVLEIKTLVETLAKQHISPQMEDLLRKLDRDQDGWVFYDEFEAALTPDLLNILGKKSNAETF